MRDVTAYQRSAPNAYKRRRENARARRASVAVNISRSTSTSLYIMARENDQVR